MSQNCPNPSPSAKECKPRIPNPKSPTLGRLRLPKRLRCLFAQRVLARRLIQLQKNRESRVVSSCVNDRCRCDMHDAGHSVVPSRRKKLPTEALFRFQSVVLNHKVCDQRRVTSGPVKLDALDRFVGIEIVREGASDIGRQRSSDNGYSQSIHLHIRQYGGNP